MNRFVESFWGFQFENVRAPLEQIQSHFPAGTKPTPHDRSRVDLDPIENQSDGRQA
jgi:hypothetical protein